MKYITIFLIMFYIPCFTTKDFKIIEATSQEFLGGIPEAGFGTNYRLVLLAQKNSQKLTIDQLWIADKFFKARANKINCAPDDYSFIKNDTIILKVSDIKKTTKEGEIIPKGTEKELDIPYDYNGAALIGFTLRNKRKYKEVPAFKKLGKQIYH
jgi:hypothetical protein